ncbi:MAG: hypothetical protein FWG66_09315 [Spirochaetes bacterium]|nr:hypothetical protein [Spirochaetota bacterium]
MNTIPTTFSETIPAYTAVGGKENRATTGLSAVILNRTGRYSRRAFFQELEKIGFDRIISIESSAERYDIEELSGQFPHVRFILPNREINLGEKINLAAIEAESPLFFVLWNDLKFISGGTAARMAERLSYQDEKSENKDKYKRLCTVPLILNSRYELLPTLTAPVTQRKRLKTILVEPKNEGLPTLYPHDGVGIYDRQRFINLCGFDTTLANTHWQLMDFGFRAWLWGEKISLSGQMKLSYDGQMPIVDSTVEESYRRFYLKNMMPIFRGEYARLPLFRFPGYMMKFKEGPIALWKEFSECRQWVKANRSRWCKDVRALISGWAKIAAADIVAPAENTVPYASTVAPAVVAAAAEPPHPAAEQAPVQEQEG